MTNEEATKHITTWLYAAPALPPMQVVQAMELAVNALRAGGKDKDVPTMSAGQPLTLEQLRGMEGQKVIIYRMKSTEPLEPGTVKMNGDVLGDNGTLAYHELYLLTWVAFSFPPARIDREAWEPCGLCGTLNDEIMCKFSKKTEYDKSTTSRYARARFCPNCGRPLTEEAWAELGKRVMGVAHCNFLPKSEMKGGEKNE